MVAANHNGRLELAFLDQIVHGQTELCALSIAQPADARRQTLKLDALARQVDPAAENAVLREKLQHQIVGNGDVCRVAGKGHPAERPSPFAEQRTDISRNKAGKIVSVLHTALEREGADIVA